MSCRGYVIAVAVALTVLMVLLVAGHEAWSGPKLFAVSSEHGVHLGDLPVLAVWAVGLYVCMRQWRRA